jgi:hypothetical protein
MGAFQYSLTPTIDTMQLITTPAQQQERRRQLQTMQTQRFQIVQQLDWRIQSAVDCYNFTLADRLAAEKASLLKLYKQS